MESLVKTPYRRTRSLALRAPSSLLAVMLIAATCTGCDPGQFDARKQRESAPSADATIDAGRAATREASMPKSERDAETRPGSTLDGGAERRTDAAVTDAARASDGGGDKGGLADGSTCVAPRPGQTLPLAVVAGSARVIARVQNPRGVVAREVTAIKPHGSKLLWTLMITPDAGMTQADAGVDLPSRYASVARTPLNGPWNNPSGPPAAPESLTLDEHLGPSGLPTPLIPLDLQPAPGSELSQMGLLVKATTATLYLKQYYAFASVAVFVGSLQPADFALQSKPTALFHADQKQPMFGTGAFARMGELYAFGCQYDASSQYAYPCWMGRAPDQTPDDSAAYEAYRGSPPAEQGFTHMLDQGTPLFSGSDRMTLSFNKHLGLWLAVTSGGGDKDEGVAYLRSAPQPEGPWSDPVAVPLPRTPGGLTVFFVAEHPDLAQNCGQRLLLSYLEPTSMFVLGQQFLGNIALATLDLQ